MASPSELSLDCKPHSYSMLLKSVGDQSDQTQKLEEFLSHLEEERLKIDAFKRELPLCMQLLTNAMETSRQQLQSHQLNQVPKPILEEFIPLKNHSTEESDKSNWMTSAQLWSQASNQQSSRGTDHVGFGGNGRAFHPFPKEKRTSCPSDHQSLSALPNLALACEDKDVNEKRINQESDLRRENSFRVSNGTSVILEQGKGGNCEADSQTNNNINTTTSQTPRKARRCWSPELHRRFVNALQMLGGSHVATPKQIRELMKVDGLTNDEVKSHLQKYRLHTRRPSPSPQTAASAAHQLFVLGGIWVPPEYTTAPHGVPPTTLYGGPPTAHAPAHYCTNPVAQEYHHHQLHNHNVALHDQLLVYKKPSQTQSLPESEVRGSGGDRSESIEDGKSDSSSWKADS